MPVISAITAVFTSIFGWLQGAINTVVALFWASPDNGTSPAELTVLGGLVVFSLGIGIFFLILGVLQNFFKLRT